MPDFEYRAVGAGNKVTTGYLSASDQVTAGKILVGRGLTPFDIRPKRDTRRLRLALSSSNLSEPAVIDFLARFRILLSAGLDFERAAEFLARTSSDAHARDAATTLKDELRKGVSLSNAFANPSIAMPEFVLGVTRAGEASGRIEEALAHASSFLERQSKVRSEIRSALVYPAVLIAVSFCTIAVIVTVLVPKLRELFLDSAKDVPDAAAFVFNVSDVLFQWGWTIIPLLIVFFTLFESMSRTASGGILIDRMKLTSPLLLGGIRTRLEVGTLSRQLGILLQNGVVLNDALGIAIGTCRNKALKHEIEVARASIRQGRQLSDALKSRSLFPAMFVELTSAGEEASELPVVLSRLADIYENEADVLSKRLLTLLGPALTLVLGLVIGFVVYAMMAALTSVNDLAIG